MVKDNLSKFEKICCETAKKMANGKNTFQLKTHENCHSSCQNANPQHIACIQYLINFNFQLRIFILNRILDKICFVESNSLFYIFIQTLIGTSNQSKNDFRQYYPF